MQDAVLAMPAREPSANEPVVVLADDLPGHLDTAAPRDVLRLFDGLFGHGD
jgi:ABC-type ATPase involved in cell division